MKYVGVTATMFFIATVYAANWFIGNVGEQAFPGGPHTIPVWPGLAAPSGVLFVGLAFTLRDIVHRLLGLHVVFGSILVGAALSYQIAPSFALASGVAFLVSETADLLVYSPLRKKNVFGAIIASNLAGSIIDSAIFLSIAFGSLQFMEGQVVGKVLMTVPALVLLFALGSRREAVA